MEGWIKIHRKILDNHIMKEPVLLQLFIYCVARANYKESEVFFNKKIVTLARGSFISGRKRLAYDLNVNESTVYDRLLKLESLGYISIETNNKYSIITVVEYNTYQSDISEEQQQSNNQITTTQQQYNTDKNNKNVKKNKKSILFCETEYFKNEELFSIRFYDNPKYEKFDAEHYYEAVKNWSEEKANRKINWIATARNWAMADEKKGSPLYRKPNTSELLFGAN